MSNFIPDRESALGLLKEHTKGEGLLKHAYSVEAVMRHFAEKYGEDPDKWGVIGLVHDIDYEKHPDRHLEVAPEILKSVHWPDEYIHAVLSHGWGICSDVEPVHKMEKVLFAIDELTGLITATVLVRPSKSILDLKVKSVKKKWKDKSFSSGVDRSIIQKGADMLEMDVSELIQETIDGMKKAAGELGLEGDPQL